jgi:hypothetical protein
MPTATSSVSSVPDLPTKKSSIRPRKSINNQQHQSNGGSSPISFSPLQPSRSANLAPNDSSNTGASGNANGRMLNVNDDKAEKASRRKSAHFGDLSTSNGPGAGGNSHPNAGDGRNGGRRVVSALAVQAQQQQHQMQQQQQQQGGGNASMSGGGHGNASSSGSGMSMAARRAKRLSAVAPAAPAVTLQINHGDYDEWMKMAIDNVSRRVVYHAPGV